MLTIIAMIIVVVAISLGLWERRYTRRLETESLASSSPWGIAAILFVFEALGVGASLYITRSLVRPDQNPLVLSLIVACANFAGIYSARVKTDPVTPVEIFQYFKDGLLWPTALPTLAATLSQTPGGGVGQG